MAKGMASWPRGFLSGTHGSGWAFLAQNSWPLFAGVERGRGVFVPVHEQRVFALNQRTGTVCTERKLSACFNRARGFILPFYYYWGVHQPGRIYRFLIRSHFRWRPMSIAILKIGQHL
ncbi:hypothetical protein PSAC2689_10636 [Paraburkholderia sacchari]